jgi:hypothetical protein
MTTVTLLVMTDGRRDCLARTVASATANLDGLITRGVIHDDSGDANHRCWLAKAFVDFDIVHAGQRQGFGGAIRSAWSHLLAGPPTDHVFHLEDDFLFNRPVPLDAMAEVLDTEPHLVQLALRRQPWNADERAAGGIVEQHPWDYVDRIDTAGHQWLEHRRFFTTNPSVYRWSLMRNVWPRGANSEGRFTHHLLASPKVRFGFWGSRDSGEWVEHIGHERVGSGY